MGMRPTNHLHADTRRPDRRAILRATGAALALPWLESFTPVSVDPGKPPVRLSCLFMPNGVWGKAWTPEAEGKDWELTPTLEPLAAVKDQVLVLTHLRNHNANEGEGHYVKTASLLSGSKVRRTGGRNIRCGISVDQEAARHIGHLTPLPSLELGTTAPLTVVDMGYSTIYGAHISWKSPTQPVAKEIDPARAFDRLFRTSRMGAGPGDGSILDLVLAESKSLKRRLAKVDGSKVDEYLQSVRELERRIQRLSTARRDGPVVQSAEPLSHDLDGKWSFQERCELMLDLTVMAFQTDTTRLSTFMFGNAVSPQDFSFLDGVKGGHHQLSHHENKKDKIAQYQLINRWHVQQVARMLEKMRTVEEADGSTLLDNSMVFFASGIRDGNRHEPRNLPVLLCGGGGGKIATGRHLKYERGTRLCELYVAVLRALGVPAASFGDADRPLPGVLK